MEDKKQRVNFRFDNDTIDNLDYCLNVLTKSFPTAHYTKTEIIKIGLRFVKASLQDGTYMSKFTKNTQGITQEIVQKNQNIINSNL